MYLWKTSKLVEEIKNNTITTSDEKNYYIVSTLLVLLSLLMTETAAPLPALYSIVTYGLLAFCCIIWIKVNYEANKGDQGNNFIGRSIMLSVPITIKITLLSILLMIIIMTAVTFFLDSAFVDKNLDLFSCVGSIVLTNLVFYRLNKRLKEINS